VVVGGNKRIGRGAQDSQIRNHSICVDGGGEGHYSILDFIRFSYKEHAKT